jgi:hypothetical protein
MGVIHAIIAVAVETTIRWTFSTCFTHRCSLTWGILISHASTGFCVEARLAILKAPAATGRFSAAFNVTASTLKICQLTITLYNGKENSLVHTLMKPELRLFELTLGSGFAQLLIRAILSSLEQVIRNRRT